MAVGRLIFRDFKKLYTFRAAAEKSARHVRMEDLSYIESGAMVVEKGNVIWIGHGREIPAAYKKNARVKSFKNLIGYPGFVECHTHTVFAGSRADEFEYRLQGATYQEISKRGGGIVNTVQSVRDATPANLQKISQARVNDFLRQGVTTLEIKSGYGLDFESECKILKVAKKLSGPKIVTTYLGPHALAPGFASYQAYLEETIHDLPKIKKQKLANRADIFIEKNFFELPWAEDYIRQAKEQGFDLAIHGEQFTNSGGVEMAIKYAARSVDHVVNASKDDVQKLSRSEVTAVLLPAADYYLKIAYPPARQMLDKGVRVALATDFNPGSSPTQDLAFVGLLARTQMQMSLAEVFAGYTIGAAYALGLESNVGSLDVGKSADFFVSESEIEGFFYSVGKMPVGDVYVEGQRV